MGTFDFYRPTLQFFLVMFSTLIMHYWICSHKINTIEVGLLNDRIFGNFEVRSKNEAFRRSFHKRAPNENIMTKIFTKLDFCLKHF